MTHDGRNRRQPDIPLGAVPGGDLPVRRLMPLIPRSLARLLEDAGFASIGDLMGPRRRDRLLELLSPAQAALLRQALTIWPQQFAYACRHPEFWQDDDDDDDDDDNDDDQDVEDSAGDDEDDQVSAGEDDEDEDAREGGGGDWESEEEDEVEPELQASPAGDDHSVFDVSLSELDLSDSLLSGFWANRLLTVRDLMSLPAQDVMRLRCVGWEWPLIVHRLDSLIPEGHPARPYLDRFIGSAVDPGVHRAPPRKKTR